MERLNYSDDEQLSLLKMMYPNLKEINTKYGKVYTSNNKGEIKLLDIKANVLLEIKGENYTICGGYIVGVNNNIEVFNIRTNSKKRIDNVLHKHSLNCFEELNGLLRLNTNYDTVLLNNNLNIVWEDHDYGTRLNYATSDNYGYWYKYKSYETRFKDKMFRINKYTELVDIYDYIDIGNNYSIIGTEIKDNYKRLIAVKLDRIPNVKYKLAYNNTVISTKSYCDIVKTNDIKNSDYFYCFEIIGNCIKVGVLNYKGEEVIHTEYSEITSINNGIFVVDDYNKRRIINLNTNYISEELDKNLCYIHTTLNIVIMLENNQWVLYDALGRKYKVEEIPKYFNCMYCKQCDEYLKININLYSDNPVYKYITKNLEDVLDIKKINYFNTLEWNKL